MSLDGKSPPNARFDHDAKRGANRLTIGFFLFHLSELIQTVDTHFSTTAAGESPCSARERADTTTSAAETVPKPCNPFFWMFTTLYGLCMGMLRSWAADHKTKTKVGLRTAFLMGVALIFVEVPRLAMKFENGKWRLVLCFIWH